MRNRLFCCCRFSNRAVLPVSAVIHLIVADLGTSSVALERSREPGRGNIHNALRVLDLVPTRYHNDKEEDPSHQRLINDCMCDILGVQSKQHAKRKGKVDSGSNPSRPKIIDLVSNYISVCPSMTRFTNEHMFMEIAELHRRGVVSSDTAILASALSSCADRHTFIGGAQLHALLVKVGFDSSVLVGSSLISFYSRSRRLENAHRVFQSMTQKNTVSWTALISGYAQDKQVEPCLHLFALMRQSVCKPNDITFATIFSVCTNHAFLALGKSVHGLQMRMGFDSYVHVSNALISMYAKCGNLGEAQAIFENIACKDMVSWNSMIFGYSQHGLAEQCLDLLKEMEKHIVPDAISFLGVLSSCRHACLVGEGRRCFREMIERGVKPELDHYSCMVDLLGRAGLIDEAWDLIQMMSMPPNGIIWGSLLASCRVHGSISIGIHAAVQRLKLEPGCAATHVQLANLYASIGCWGDVARVRKVMKERGLKTNIGCSWIEVGSKVYSFTAENRSKSQVNNILAILDCLQSHMECKYDILIDGLECDDPEHVKFKHYINLKDHVLPYSIV
ncbi:pentatricopeptide repeat-containing protein At2g37320-like [Phragmites australis]|uniref:pentatricopeptide repeat-containing protein At2g37320-like n=1 Tax=Phragmites australis TaxID=29695 RepID=UPI002D799AF7|nr:pentatricopeptide repeat-containing protein At2g37320-like [Phragmites australis]XP_062199415.1 pentatricopeptide repeat-containing protein At2g37320-like [Phragmites australis]